MSYRLLFVDDDSDLRDKMVQRLAERGFEVTPCATAAQARAALQGGGLDVVVTDLLLEPEGGLALCEWMGAKRPDVPVIIISDSGSLDEAVGAIRAGAYDFICKPLEVEELVLSAHRAIGHRALREEVARLRKEVRNRRRFESMLGDSDEIQRVFDLIDKVADTDASVLITGESGTGKELVARAIHQRSRRAGGPFLAISCAAVPDSLLESELFGHVKGAFTDAKATRTGLLAQADGGSFFLDELGDLPASLQAKLLRALEERTVRPVGGNAEIPFDTRLITATHVDLDEAVADRRFREDFYYRINVVHIRLPPLRERGGDVLTLAQHFVERFAEKMERPVAGISTAVAEQLMAYGWPGNVRELRNCIERAVALTQHDRITVDDLPDRIRRYQVRPIYVAAGDPAELVSMQEVERRYITRVMEAVGGSKTTAARILGFDRKTLYRKLARYGLTGEDGSREGD